MEPSKIEQNELKEKILAIRHAKDPDKKVSIEDAAAELATLLDKYEWFYDVVVEGRAICVYVTHMGPHMNILPDVYYGFQIKEGFSSYLTCKDKYGAKSGHVAFAKRSDDDY